MASELFKKAEYYLFERMYEEAYVYFLEAALTERNAEAIDKLGRMYLAGEYVECDYIKAFKYFKLAYDISHNLNFIICIMDSYDDIAKNREGRIAYRDFFDYLIKCGEWAMYITIGGEYGSGKIYEQDVEKQIECYEKAIEKGINMGYDCLAELYFEGKNVSPDYEKAYKYLSSYEGEASNVKKFIIAEMYRRGIYLKKDVNKAKELYQSIVDDDFSMKYDDEFYIRSVEILEKME